jgi:hypothetical protein
VASLRAVRGTQFCKDPRAGSKAIPFQHERGVTPGVGLYMLGLPWQHTRASALLGRVARDAEFLAERMSTIDSSTTASGAR